MRVLRKFIGFWSTIVYCLFGRTCSLKDHYETEVHTFFSLVTSRLSHEKGLWDLGLGF